ncbi:cbb3-type cytochrome oxidase subunit 3 [Zhongshania sp. BJYM1]|jgi:cytochrome c oxidase cbb3-type subunit IV|uniref:cbb3-type cytochrome oxidase subunit 3 n=1 Tax=Zhongshania aquatica TaxID=2965069 RepID=UPI0022B4738E|nr:CcoQ/FixQ family Cbb3-type cytochrome c oxidase assembly chaperone [Marortus sp. BJYM1]
MDQDSLRAIATLMVFIAFIALSFSVFRKSRKAYFEDAALLPFVADDPNGKPDPIAKRTEKTDE